MSAYLKGPATESQWEKFASLNYRLRNVFGFVSSLFLACVAGVQRGGRGEVECEREARSLGARREQAPNDRASRSHSTSPLPPLCTPATQASLF